MPYGYGYGGYPAAGGYYAPPVPDQLAQLRQNQFQQPMIGQTMQNQPATQQAIQPAAPATVSLPAQPTSNGILWVQGEEGAKAWMVAPGTTVMLMDSDGSSFYLKSADASGMPQPLRIFDYTERTVQKVFSQPAESVQSPQADYVTREEWNALKARAEALEEELAAMKAVPLPKAKKTSAKEDAE